jgi:hypothetical protein
MKMVVVTNKAGEVISTYRPAKNPGKDDPSFGIHGGPGHEVHELEMPDEYWEIESAEELHRRVGEHLKSQR